MQSPSMPHARFTLYAAFALTIALGCGSGAGTSVSGADAGEGDSGSSSGSALDGSGSSSGGSSGGPITCSNPGNYTMNGGKCGVERWNIKTGTDSQAAGVSL